MMLNIEICEKIQFYYLYNSLINGFHISNCIFHELSIQLIIEFSLTFNRSVKPTLIVHKIFNGIQGKQAGQTGLE